MGDKYVLHFFDHETENDKYTIWALTAGILIKAASIMYQRPPDFQERRPTFWSRSFKWKTHNFQISRETFEFWTWRSSCQIKLQRCVSYVSYCSHIAFSVTDLSLVAWWLIVKVYNIFCISCCNMFCIDRWNEST